MSPLRIATLITSFAAVYFAVRAASAVAELHLVDASLHAVLTALLLRGSVGLAQAAALESGGPT